jgi:periplasmic divalent cation tolerance protein
MLIVLTTVGSAGEGENLARLIVEEKLGACVQILPGMTSVYFWEGKIRSEGEHLLLIKTLEEKFDSLSAFINQHHSYEVPEIVAIDAEKISEKYLGWVEDNLTPQPS